MEVVTSASLLHPLHLRAKRREPQLLPSPSATFPSRSRLRGGASRVCIGRRWTYSVPPRQRYLLFKTNALKGEGEVPDVVDGRILAGSMVTVALAVANRVVYKLALVPMKDYPFFLAQVTTFGYAAVYFAILYVRYRAGIVTTVMLGVPKSLFMAIGLLEALGVAAGMSAGSQLPGPAIPILSQTFLVWQLIFLVLILGRRYSYNQVFGCLLIAVGVVLAVASILPARTTNFSGCEGAPLLPLLFIATNMAFNILLLNLVKMSSALVSSLVVTVSVPMSISVLSLPLPYEYSSRL